MLSPHTVTLATAFLVLSAALPSPALARHAFAEFPVLDSIEVFVRGDELIAIDGGLGPIAGTTKMQRLDRGEEVLQIQARGAVAIVITDERVLATTLGFPRWMWTYIGVHESLPYVAVLGDRVALVLTDQRAIGLSAETRKQFFSIDFGPNETVHDGFVGDSVAVVVTDRRLLGMSAFLPGFFEQQVGIHDRIEFVSARSDFATVSTRQNLFVFQAPTATWAQRRLSLH